VKKIPEQKIRQRLLSQASSISHKHAPSGEINEEARTVVLTFSSEAPVDRWFGKEVLDHGAAAVRLARINRGGAFLLNHDRNQQIGVVLEATVEGRRGKALVKFSRNKLGEEAFQDVKDGIRGNVSVSYRYHELKLEEQSSDGPDTYRVTDWEPLEISLEAVPADPSVGVGRGSHFDDINLMAGGFEEEAALPTREEVVPLPVEKTAEDERKRALEVISLGDRFGKPEMARAALTDGLSVDEFSRKLLVSMESRPELPPASSRESLGLGRDEVKKFSFLRAMRAALNNDWRGAEFEREVSEAAAAKFKRQTSGFLVPSDVIFASRAETTTAGASAGSLVATNIPQGSFIEALRAKLVIRQLGAKILSGLDGNVTLPRMAGGAKAFWVAETKDVEEQPFTTDQVPLSPKSVGAFTDISRRLILQSSIDVEEVIREDLASAVAMGIDLAAIAGSGRDNQPRGLLFTDGVSALNLDASLDFTAVVALETAIAKANANFGSLAYLTNPRVSGLLKTTLVNANSSVFIWGSGSNGRGTVNGYPAEVSTIVPDNLGGGGKSAVIFGNWADLVIGEWGILDVQVNPYLKGTSGTVRVRVLQDVDIAVRHPQSFSFYDSVPTPSAPASTPTPTPTPRGRSSRGGES
jgi:HK97 family phage major capsid protein